MSFFANLFKSFKLNPDMKKYDTQPAEGIPSQNEDKAEKPVEQIIDENRDTGNKYFDFFKIEKETHTLFGLNLAPGVKENPYFKYCTFHIKSGDFVKRGQKIFTFSYDSSFFGESPNYVPFNAPQDGYFEKFVDLLFIDNRYIKLEAIFFAIFPDSLSRFKEIFSFEIKEVVDEFTMERKMFFSVIGFPEPHLFKFYSSAAYRTPNKYISFSYDFGFYIENVSGYDFVIFRFDKEFRLSEGDTIYFLFDNQEILKFEITGKPFTIIQNSTKGFKLPLFIEDIELFKFT